ncbi:MAG TPA: invasin domain 3-containing protein [Planctomycetota bacterium]|nr:invasin domain 3-containing protein [Planctomycetota bacterium]
MKTLSLRHFGIWAAAALLLVLGYGQASGYMSIRVATSPVPSAVGQAVRWNLGAARPNVANRRILYEIGDAGCADSALFTGGINEFQAIQDSFNNWRRIRESDLDFEFAGSTTNAVTSASDNRNVLRFVGSNISSGVFAVTITTFDTTTGEILDADMELNDRDFTWDTLGQSRTTGTPGRAYIESVVTHEIGHFVGLDHPANSQSTLYFASSPGLFSQASLERDDIAPIIQSYPHPSLSDPALGSVSGVVTDAMAAGQFGVGVVLVNLATGKNVVGHVTEKPPAGSLGSYLIQGVPPGNYIAFALPIQSSQLGSYYASAFTSFYPVVRGVAFNTVGAPTLVKVAPGQAFTGANLSLPAAGGNPFEPNNTSAQATTLASGEAAVAQITPAADVDFFKFTATAGQTCVIRVLSDAFGFALNPTLTLLDTNGTTVLASPISSHPAYLASANDRDGEAFDASGPDYDAEIVFTLPAAGTYFFAVASRAGLTAGQYLVTLELRGADTSADNIATKISSSAAGVPADGTSTFTINIDPRNQFDVSLAAPNTYTVDLVDRSGSPVILQTLSSQSAPFNFTVTALASPGTKTYGCRVNGVDMAATVQVSHFGTLSALNSRVILSETSVVANGYDFCTVQVQLRDSANNLFADSAAAVVISTTLGTLDNGSATGASVAGVYDPALGLWAATLKAGTAAGLGNISATANAQPLSAQTLTFLAAATGTGSGGGGSSNDTEDDGGGGCTAGGNAAWLAILALLVAALAARRVSRAS